MHTDRVQVSSKHGVLHMWACLGYPCLQSLPTLQYWIHLSFCKTTDTWSDVLNPSLIKVSKYISSKPD